MHIPLVLYTFPSLLHSLPPQILPHPSFTSLPSSWYLLFHSLPLPLPFPIPRHTTSTIPPSISLPTLPPFLYPSTNTSYLPPSPPFLHAFYIHSLSFPLPPHPSIPNPIFPSFPSPLLIPSSLLWGSTVRIRYISLCINKLLQGHHWLALMRFKYKSEPKTFSHDEVNEQKEQPWTLKRLSMSCVYTIKPNIGRRISRQRIWKGKLYRCLRHHTGIQDLYTAGHCVLVMQYWDPIECPSQIFVVNVPREFGSPSFISVTWVIWIEFWRAFTRCGGAIETPTFQDKLSNSDIK